MKLLKDEKDFIVSAVTKKVTSPLMDIFNKTMIAKKKIVMDSVLMKNFQQMLKNSPGYDDSISISHDEDLFDVRVFYDNHNRLFIRAHVDMNQYERPGYPIYMTFDINSDDYKDLYLEAMLSVKINDNKLEAYNEIINIVSEKIIERYQKDCDDYLKTITEKLN